MNIILMHQQICYLFVETTPRMDTNRLHTPLFTRGRLEAYPRI